MFNVLRTTFFVSMFHYYNLSFLTNKIKWQITTTKQRQTSSVKPQTLNVKRQTSNPVYLSGKSGT